MELITAGVQMLGSICQHFGLEPVTVDPISPTWKTDFLERYEEIHPDPYANPDEEDEEADLGIQGI